MPKINVHEKALGHLTRGLYRSPASAIRELVSNGWDANATKVAIQTDYPDFYWLEIIDNGNGFSKEDFKELMSKGIGNSQKRPTDLKLSFNRQVIGRLGIGMLGIAQICGSFTIESKPKNGSPFKARIKLYDLIKQKLDADSAEIVHPDALENTETGEKYSIVDIGTYDFEKFDDDNFRFKHGTRIFTNDLHPTFTQTFQQSTQLPDYFKPDLDWQKNIRDLSKTSSLQVLGDYWRFLWELSIACPLQYFNERAVPKNLIEERQHRLCENNFSVTVDGCQLFNPVFLATKRNQKTVEPPQYTTSPIGPVEAVIYGRNLKFEGYLAVKDGSQIKPDELRGILIRIKNVGIGYYDASLLDYRINEGPRSRWVTGEIFVSDGLEDALNVDRDSFNKFHPEFRFVQKTVHSILRAKIFPKVYQKIEERSVERHKVKALKHREMLSTAVKVATHKNLRIRHGHTDATRTIVQSEVKRDQISVTVSQDEIDDFPKKNRNLFEAILTIYEVALAETTPQRRKAQFVLLLKSLLRKW